VGVALGRRRRPRRRMTASLTLGAAQATGRNNFNLIRLLAAWAVIYGHAWPLTGSPGQDLVLQLVQLKFAGGVAVDVFFLVSGLLITASLERNRLPAFLAARALRILPALAACVALCAFVLGPAVTTAADYWHQHDTWRFVWRNITLLRDTVYFLPGVFETLPDHAVDGSLWSLPIEAKLYLAMAVLGTLSLHRRWRFNVLYVLGMVAGLALVRTPLPPHKANLAWCAAFFMTGAFAWLNRDALRLHWAILAATLVAAALLRGHDGYRFAYFVALAYGTLYLAYVPRLPVIRHHDVSYGLYLYGWPAAQVVQTLAPGTGVVGNVIGATAIAGALAVASWFCIEAPALRLKARFRVRRAPVAAPDAAMGAPVEGA
jgi:peptidoglycan/LPS O-acetylase OafA/YrhL